MNTSSKRILLTGASSGIGEALARELARQGHRLAITARRADRLKSLAAEFQGKGADIAVFPADLADPDVLKPLIDDVVEYLGGLDVLINNAGYGLARPFGEEPAEDLRHQIEVNLTAPILLTREALSHIVEAKGTIINVGSSITCVAVPIFGVYGATKAGLAYWNDALRREVRHKGVHVCLVEPGPVKTEFLQVVQEHDRQGIENHGWSPKTKAARRLTERPPDFLVANAEQAAKRIARLIVRPRRRLSVLRRAVWPFRLIGGWFQVAPFMGDAILGRLIARSEQPPKEGENVPSSG
jgi:short-subunit dehydrogenase